MVFPFSKPREKDRGSKDMTTELAYQHFKPKIQFSLKFIEQKWIAQNKIHYLNTKWTRFKNEDRFRNLREENFSRDAGDHDTS